MIRKVRMRPARGDGPSARCRIIGVIVCLLAVCAGPQTLAGAPLFIRTASIHGGIDTVSAPIAASGHGELNYSSTSFELIYGSGLPTNSEARDAFDQAAANWAALLRDPVTVKIDVDFAALPENVLGTTSTVLLLGGYNTVRNLVADNAGETNNAREAALLPNLPEFDEFDAYLPTDFSMGGYAILSQANYLALGGTRLVNKDGSIKFSSDFSWDYDPSDGIDAGKFDFVGVAMHEIGHILGFISEVDYVDWKLSQEETADDVWPRPLDLFRFKTDDLGAGFDFTDTPRMLVPGYSHSFYFGDGSALMATGVYNGDGRQASHWKDNLGLGIMDPTGAPGELLVVTDIDLIALDLIGWEVVPEPATLTLMLIGAVALVRRRRR